MDDNDEQPTQPTVLLIAAARQKKEQAKTARRPFHVVVDLNGDGDTESESQRSQRLGYRIFHAEEVYWIAEQVREQGLAVNEETLDALICELIDGPRVAR